MKSHDGTPRGAASGSAGNFSLVSGGPLYRLWLTLHLARPPLSLLHRRLLVSVALAWLPLLALSWWEGTAACCVQVPFLHDIETHVRCLVAIPLLLLAEVVVHNHMRFTAHQFRERGIIPSASLQAEVASTLRLRDSPTIEVAILITAFLLLPIMWEHDLVLRTSSWYARIEPQRVVLTGAGQWLVHVSVPLFQFLMLRWYFRILVWWHFLWRVSRLRLQLNPLHPDCAGGIGFLGEDTRCFELVLAAQSAVASALIANRVFYLGAKAVDFLPEVAVLAILLICLVTAPLLFFMPALYRARMHGLRRYGALSAEYAHEFGAKWLKHGSPRQEPLLGNADIQSLANLASSSEIVQKMKSVPVDRRVMLQLALAVVAPFLPLVLTALSFSEILRQAVSMLF